MPDRPDGPRPTYQAVRTGGRSERIRVSVLQATMQELQSVGYADLSIPRVAQAAGVAVTTIYRRWPSKTLLLADAFAALSAQSVPEPDLGTLRADLLALATSLAAMLTEPVLANLLRSVLSLSTPELDELTLEHWRGRHAVTERIVERAVLRGEIPPQPSPRRVVEAVTATIWLRAFVTRGPLDEPALAELVDDALLIAQHPRPR